LIKLVGSYLIIDELGDLSAEPGSRDWAIAVRHKLLTLIDQKETTEKHIAPYLELMERYEGYKQLDNENDTTFTSVEEFLTANYPFGLEGKIERENGGYKLRKHGGDRRSDGFQDDNSNVEKQGNSKSYILARLERDHPDILADFEAGKYRSARQAGIAAGFVKDRKYIQVAPDPERIARKLQEVLTLDQIAELITLLS